MCYIVIMEDADTFSGCSDSQPFSLDYQSPSSASASDDLDLSRADTSSNGGSSSFCSANISSDDDDSFIIDDDDESVTTSTESTCPSHHGEGNTGSTHTNQFSIINETLPFVKSTDMFKTFLTEFPNQRDPIPQAHSITTHTCTSPSTDHAFLDAAKLGNLERLKTFIKSGGVSINMSDKDGRTALHIACSLGHIEMVRYLIEHAGNVDAFSLKNKQTPLHETCIGGHTKVLQLLLLEVADLDVVDHLGRSAAHYCAIHGEDECLEILCSQGCDVCLEDSMNRTGVHFAAMNDHCDIIQILMERGADLDVADIEGKTPVHYAVRYGRVKALQSLLKNAVDINQGDSNGSLPSHEAAFYDNLQCLKILLKKGAKITAQDSKGRNIIHKAAQGKSLNCLHWILSSGRLHVNSTDYSGNNGLHYAASNGFSEGYHCLLQHGAADSMIDTDGKTPLDIARKYGKYNSIMRAVDGKSLCRQCNNDKTASESQQKNTSQSSTTLSDEVKNTLFNIPESVRLNNPGIKRTIKKDRSDVGSNKVGKSPSKKTIPRESSSHFTLAAKYYGPPI